jgi:hypothetical protein
MEKDILPPSSESSDQNELIPDPYTKGINFFGSL